MKAAFDVIAKGGVVMIPLGLCSVLALAVAIERACRWLRLGGISEADRVLALAGRGDWDEATRAGEQSTRRWRACWPPAFGTAIPRRAWPWRRPPRMSWLACAGTCPCWTRSSPSPRSSVCSGR